MKQWRGKMCLGSFVFEFIVCKMILILWTNTQKPIIYFKSIFLERFFLLIVKYMSLYVWASPTWTHLTLPLEFTVLSLLFNASFHSCCRYYGAPTICLGLVLKLKHCMCVCMGGGGGGRGWQKVEQNKNNSKTKTKPDLDLVELTIHFVVIGKLFSIPRSWEWRMWNECDLKIYVQNISFLRM